VQVNLHDAKTHLSRYVEQALAGKALVRLVPIAETPRRRHLGFLQGSAQLSTDLKAGFNAEIDSMFG
jgi:antitoxin (DNA-binding transcriptional repressor) of toxin-antitoxin stability system